jgi:hypothetical protein
LRRKEKGPLYGEARHATEFQTAGMNLVAARPRWQTLKQFWRINALAIPATPTRKAVVPALILY